MKVVELLGPPGSGKTSLARELVRSIPGAVDLDEAVRAAVGARGEDGISRTVAGLSRSSSGRLWRAAYARSADRFSGLARFIGANPEAMEAVLAGQRSRAERDRGQHAVLGWVLNLMARYQLAVERGGQDWLVIDEGFCQRGVALFSYGFMPFDRPSLDAYLTAVPQPDAVVVVDTPLDVCIERLDRKGWSQRVVDLDNEQRAGFLADTFTAVEAVTEHLESAGIRLIWVDGTTPFVVSQSAIAATLAP